ATHKQLNEQVLKNLRKINAGAMQLDNFIPVGELGKFEGRFLLAIYEEQHPEAAQPLPAMPDPAAPAPAHPAQPQSTAQPNPAAQPQPAAHPQPAPPAPAAGEPPRGAAAPAGDEILANGSTAPLKKSSTDALCNVICFLSAKSHGADFLPPTEA